MTWAEKGLFELFWNYFSPCSCKKCKKLFFSLGGVDFEQKLVLIPSTKTIVPEWLFTIAPERGDCGGILPDEYKEYPRSRRDREG